MVSGTAWRVLALARMAFPLVASFLVMLAGGEQALQGGGIVAPYTRCSWMVRALVLCFDALPATVALTAGLVANSSVGSGPFVVYTGSETQTGFPNLVVPA